MSTPLVLNLEFARAEQADDPFAFRFSPQVYLVRGDGGGVKTINLDWTPALLSDLAAVRLPGRDPAISQRLGERLRRFLQTSAWPIQEAQILAAVQTETPITLTIRSAAAELYALPWELLTLQATGQSLGEIPSLLLRYEWPETATAPADRNTQQEHGRILCAWSAADGAVPAAEHIAAIVRASSSGFYPFDPQRDVLSHVSCGGLIAALSAAKKEGPPITVLHLLCHGAAIGQTYGLAVNSDSEGGDSVIVDAARLRQLLAPYAGMLRLVVLSACDSGNTGAISNQLGSIAQTLHRAGVAQVIASRYPLSVAGSICFTDSFYSELLGPPSSVEQALLAARKQLALDPAQLDWAAIQLYARAADGLESRPLVIRPYRGLLAFQPEHRRFFFGRDREVAELVADWKALHDQGEPRLLAIDGASGTGKSSVLFAGALPQLLSRMGPGARLVRMRPGSAPEQALTTALAARAGTEPVLLVVDQFEELFTHVEDPKLRQSFVRRLWKLATGLDSLVSVILTLRSDFVGRCGDLAVDKSGLRLDRVIYDEAHRVSVAQMNPRQMREVIEKPAERVGLQLEHGLAERMLADVDREPGALPLLADTLDLLWQRRTGNTLAQAAYDEIGGVTGALHGRADQLVAALTDEEQRQARRLLVRLGSGLTEASQGVRLRVPVLARRPMSEPQSAQFDRALARLVEARLLVLDQEKNEQTVEVAHEALLRKWPRLAEWVREDRQMLLQVETVEGWVRESRRSATLLGADRLAYAEKVEAEYGEALSSDAGQLLTASREAQRVAEERDRFAHDSLRMLAAIEVSHDAARQAVILREAESADPTKVPGFLGTSLSILYSQAVTIAELLGHSGEVFAASFSPDGTRILTASREHTARVFDIKGNAQPIVLSGHEDFLEGAEWSPDGSRILTWSHDRTARVWRGTGDAAPWILSGHEDQLYHAAWSPDGSRIATVDGQGIARVWNVTSKQPVVLRGPALIWQVAWSPDGKLIATASDDGIVRVWPASGSEKPLKLKGHDGGVQSVQFHPRGNYLLTTGQDGTARLFSVTGHDKPTLLYSDIRCAVFSPDGEWIAVGTTAGIISVSTVPGDGFNAITDTAESLWRIAFSRDGQRIAAVYGNGMASVFSRNRDSAPLKLRGHRGQVWTAAFSPDGRQLVTASADGTARLWDVAREAMPQSTVFENDTAGQTFIWCCSPGEEVIAEVPTPDGRLCAKAEGVNVRIARSPGGETVISSGHKSPIRCLRFSADGKRIVTGGEDGQVQVWNSNGSGTPTVLAGHISPVSLAVFSPDGQKILTMSDDGMARIFWAGGRSENLFLDRQDRPVAISADWKKIITEINGVKLLWDLELDPAAIKQRLWRATPFCLSPAERERHLNEPHDIAIENYNASLAAAKRAREQR